MAGKLPGRPEVGDPAKVPVLKIVFMILYGTSTAPFAQAALNFPKLSTLGSTCSSSENTKAAEKDGKK